MIESLRRSGLGALGLVLALASNGCSGGGAGKPGGAGGTTPHDASADRAGDRTSASGGAPPVGGGGGGGAAGGSGGGGGPGGVGGAPAEPCTFSVAEAQSPAISTVEIVTWTLVLPNLTAAHIDFGPSGVPPTMTAPVDLTDSAHRTVLVGMKAEKAYTFRVVATDGATTCTSADVSFMTGALPSNAPTITKPVSGTGGAQGFIVTTTGLDITSISTGQPNAYVFDTDGDVVWWSSSMLMDPNGISRAHLSWDATEMWVMTTDRTTINISMDGLTTTNHPELSRADHDFAVLPDGGIATPFRPTGTQPGPFVEWHPDGTVSTVVASMGTLYGPNDEHPNAVHYYPADDTYTLSDAAGSLFVKFKRTGELIWQLGGTNPLGASFTLVGIDPWKVNHGHHLTPDGHFLFFNNGPGLGSSATIFDLLLDEAAGTATLTWEYQTDAAVSAFLGDAERLPDGNALVTYSMSGLIEEVDPSGTVVQSWKSTTFGFSDFRTSLYGPPPR